MDIGRDLEPAHLLAIEQHGEFRILGSCLFGGHAKSGPPRAGRRTYEDAAASRAGGDGTFEGLYCRALNQLRIADCGNGGLSTDYTDFTDGGGVNLCNLCNLCVDALAFTVILLFSHFAGEGEPAALFRGQCHFR